MKQVSKWWHRPKHHGLRMLAIIFNPDRAELIKIARPYHRVESKATRPNHIHKHNPAGSKLKKLPHLTLVQEWMRQKRLSA